METQLSRAEKLDRLFGTPAFAVIIAILCNAMWSRCSGGSIWGALVLVCIGIWLVNKAPAKKERAL